MMKYTLITISACFLFFGLSAQNTFLNHINTENESYGSVIAETYTGELIIGLKEQKRYSKVRVARIAKLDTNGNVLYEKEIKGYPDAMIDRIKPYDSLGKAFLICGSIDTVINNHCRRKIFVDLIDYNLNTLKRVDLFCPDEFQKGVIRDIECLSDSTCFILDRFGPNHVEKFRVWKINLNTGFVAVYNINDLNTRLAYGSMINEQDSLLYITYSGTPIDTNQKSHDKILQLDYNLQYIDCIDLPSNLTLYVQPMRIPDGNYILTGLGSFENAERRGVNVCKMDFEHNLLNSFGIYSETSDTVIYSQSYNSLTLLENEIVVASIYNIDIHGYPVQGSPCWIMITLLDLNVSNPRQYYFGDGINAYYGADIISTQDDGVAISGVYFDPRNLNIQPDIFVLNLKRGDLVTTGINESEWFGGPSEVIVWPNPGRDIIHIRSAIQLKNAVFEMFDIYGKISIIEQLSPGSIQTISLNNLPQGYYSYRIIDGDRMVSGGKWIRE